jgi:hypothetical protein
MDLSYIFIYTYIYICICIYIGRSYSVAGHRILILWPGLHVRHSVLMSEPNCCYGEVGRR